MKSFYNKRFFTIGGWFTWVAVGVAVVGGTVAAVQANQQKKAAQGQAGAALKQQQSMASANTFRPPTLPNYIPFDFQGTQKQAIKEDQDYYVRSDADFKHRHAPIVGAEKLFEQSVLKDQQGESELMPMVQNELTRAGIASTLDSLGTTGAGSVLAPGSAGEANVARNLGLGVLQFQDRNRANREHSLSIAEDIFPRRTFGMSGADFASSAISETQNQNAWLGANYERQFAAEQAKVGQQAQVNNAQMTSQNAMAQANAQADAARTAAIVGAATSAISAGAKAYGSQAGSTSVSGAVRPTQARYPGSNTWVPVGRYA